MNTTRNRLNSSAQDAGVIGWISISEVFLLCGVTMLAVAMGVQSNLQKTTTTVHDLKGVVAKLEEQQKKDDETITRLRNSLNTWETERATLLAQLADQKTAVAMRAELEAKLATAEAAKAKLTKELAKAEADKQQISRELMIAKAEQERLKNERVEIDRLLVAKDKEIDELTEKINKINATLSAPPDAKLIVKVSCDSLDYDLDLWIQDPHDRICFWQEPRTLWRENVTGMLILSEDIRSLKKTSEEIYYSTQIQEGSLNKPYLVYCMVRDKNNPDKKVAINLRVKCEVTVIQNGFPHVIFPRENDKKETVFMQTGLVNYVGPKVGEVAYETSQYSPDNLVPLVGFSINDGQIVASRIYAPAELAAYYVNKFRGWSSVAVPGTPTQKPTDTRR